MAFSASTPGNPPFLLSSQSLGQHLLPTSVPSCCVGFAAENPSQQRQQHLLPAVRSARRPEEPQGLRVFAVSDLHADYADNITWVRSLSSNTFQDDALIVAGDVAETRVNFEAVMGELRGRFQRVFFVPGNHDLWCRREGGEVDSLDKLDALLETCKQLDIDTGPAVLDGVGIIPLFSWYHKSFDKEEDIVDVRIPSLEMVCKDFHACRWPSNLSNNDCSLASFFDSMNELNRDAIQHIQNNSSQIITFSHYVPRQELCPEKRMLSYPHLPKIMGSDFLESRLRLIHGANGSKTACHIFGHTHFCWDTVIDGIRYIQAPLAYPRERKRRMNGGEGWLPFCVYTNGRLTRKISLCYWSDYHSRHRREPVITELSVWIAKFYKKYM